MLPSRIHLVGIGGAGMAALAEYLLAAGHRVSGSDQVRSPAAARLAGEGAAIAFEHAAALVEDADLVVVSDAIPAGNVEIEAAWRRGVPVLPRAACLDRLRGSRRAIMVAGSHGKSTTSAMIAAILAEAGLDPGFVLGADVPDLGGRRARPGGGPLFVAEACEAFRNLDHLHPDLAVITNVDDEHVNHYASQVALDTAFAAFAGRASTIVAAGDDAGVQRIRPALSAVTSYGLDPTCAVSAEPEPAPFAVRAGGSVLGEIALRLPGDHMRRNALAAIAVCRELGVPFATMAQALGRFTGVARRWQDTGTTAGVRIVDDFAHHPAEIAASLRAARSAAPGRRLVAACQPLLHSRVTRLHEAFADSLAAADLVLLLEVDGGGEVAGSAGSAAIADGLARRGVAVRRREDPEDLIECAPDDLADGDLLVIMGGAGIAGAAERLHARLREGRAVPALGSVRGRGWMTRLGEAWRRSDDTLVGLFRAAARSGPQHPAVMDRQGPLSYADLDRASDEVAAGLAARALGGTVIGVSLPLSRDLLVALLGVMKARAVYLPLDLALPAARRRYMLERAGASALIGRDAEAPHPPVLTVAELRRGGGRVPAGPRGGDDAYICFTSGSTGYPKGIRIRQAAFAALLRDTVARFGIAPGARMLLNTSISFDVSLAEIGGTLAGGGALVIGGARPLAGERLLAALAADAVTHLSITPTLLSSTTPRPLPALACIIACGEACPPDLVRQWAPARRFFNVYGPTETTIYATAAQCTADAEITIGTPLAHLDAHVLDAELRPVADGAMGELCLSGPGVAAGYIERPDETARHFAMADGVRVYRSGDMVQRRPDGALRFIGRADDQVKLLGNRIELGEIERAVMRQPGVADAAVCVGSGEPATLVCFVQPAPGSTPDLAALTEQLGAWLPAGAVPSHMLAVPAIHTTPSGKKDRRRMLLEHHARIVTRAAFGPARNDTEQRLADLWREVLKLEEPVGMFDRFAALGGDSLSALLLVARVEDAFGIAVPPGYFGRVTTVPQMAVQLADLRWHREGNARVGEDFTDTRIYRQLRDLCGHWPGERQRPDSLISALGPADAAYQMFLCCQDEIEFVSLARHLPPAFRLHAMRSGHLVIDQSPGSLRQLSTRYAEEIMAIGAGGALVLTGVCQGGTIAAMVGEMLAAAGRPPLLLALIEPGRPRPYAGRAALLCGEDSFLNPLRPGGIGRAPFDAALPAGYSLDLVPGGHDAICREPAVQFVAHHLARRVENAAAPLPA